ncbi:hypothetical protein AAG570_013619 [Ranatra chinensis]|uniref:Uncharacterized protein n=1 Tax=Ranatra chinensis TaxID=642074 RepID=A0ABD0YV84_9HEMI
MASKRRNMFYQNKKQETTEIGTESRVRRSFPQIRIRRQVECSTIGSGTAYHFTVPADVTAALPDTLSGLCDAETREAARNALGSMTTYYATTLPRPESLRSGESSGVDGVVLNGGSNVSLPVLEASSGDACILATWEAKRWNDPVYCGRLSTSQCYHSSHQARKFSFYHIVTRS